MSHSYPPPPSNPSNPDPFGPDGPTSYVAPPQYVHPDPRAAAVGPGYPVATPAEQREFDREVRRARDREKNLSVVYFVLFIPIIMVVLVPFVLWSALGFLALTLGSVFETSLSSTDPSGDWSVPEPMFWAWLVLLIGAYVLGAVRLLIAAGRWRYRPTKSSYGLAVDAALWGSFGSLAFTPLILTLISGFA